MINPMGKGILTFNNSVNFRGYERVNLLAAIFMVMYGPDHEKDFVGTSGKLAITKRNALYMENVTPVVDRYDAIVEVMMTYLSQSDYAKSTFDATTDFSSSDEEYKRAMEYIKRCEVEPVLTVEETVKESQSIVEEVPAIEEENNKVPNLPADVPVEDKTTADLGAVSEEMNASAEEVHDYEEDVKVQVPDTVSVPQYSEDLVIQSDDNKYMVAIKGKVTQEVKEFKAMPNKQTAVRLCNKLLALLPGENLLDIIYNKDVVHVLYGEFEGAAYLLSSFRVLAIGIATGGVTNA